MITSTRCGNYKNQSSAGEMCVLAWMGGGGVYEAPHRKNAGARGAKRKKDKCQGCCEVACKLPAMGSIRPASSRRS